MTQQPTYFPVEGGLDLVSAKKAPGVAIAALNYEPVSAGYRRLQGYERFDGHAAPSDASYWRVNYTLGGFGTGTAPALGDILYNGSPDHFIVVAIVISSGTFAGGDAAGYFIATDYQGTITPTQVLFNLPSAGQNVATAGTITLNYDFGATQNAIYQAAAVAATRAKIAAVPGSGPVRGVWLTANGDIIAMRDNVGATAGVMWKATTAGWTAVVVYTRIDFTCDTATQTLPTNVLVKIAAGVANASTSTSDGRIRRVVITSTVGTVNTGYFLVSSYVAAQFTAAGQTIYLAGAATVLGTTTAAASTATIPAGGRYFFVNHNFFGAADLAATYMVNGVGKALIYDSAGFAEISTGMTTDKPTRIAAHRGSLFLAFPGGSLQFSQVGEPSVFDAVVGAGEIGVGSDITDLIPANKTTLAIFAEASVSVLYGSDSTDYLLETLTDEAGGLPYSAQRVGQVLYMDVGGLRTLASTPSFGNFNFATLSQLVSPLLEDFRHDGVNPIASFPVRHRNQYWVLFDNGAGLACSLSKKRPEFLPVSTDLDVSCACSVELDTDERIFLGDESGYVFEFDKGTNFDGAAIEHYVRFAFNDFGGPRIDKRAHELVIDMAASGTATISVSVDLDNGSTERIASQELVLTTGGGAIDDLGSNELYYASQIDTQGIVYIDGVAKNFSLKVSGETDDEEPHTLTGITYYVSPRRLVR